VPEAFDPNALLQSARESGAADIARKLHALHFPVAFPEVFQRDRPGFDCIVGNTPWEEATVEELGFFALRFPGLKSMGQADQRAEVRKIRRARPDLVEEYERAVVRAERMRQVLLAGPYPGMGTGDPDLYKAFAWRFWQLVREDGSIGVVLPRSALSAAGLADWRRNVLAGGTFSDVTMLLNNRQWIFQDVHPQYTIGLVTIRKGPSHVGRVSLCGPYRSLVDYEHRGAPAVISTDEFLSWSDGASFPLLPTSESVSVFSQLRSQPRFDARGSPFVLAATELHATNDKRYMVITDEPEGGLWPVYGGRTFDLWEPDTGDYYAWAEPTVVMPLLMERRDRSATRAGSVFGEFSQSWRDDALTMPCLNPRVAFRDITNRTNRRTVIAALVPPEIVLNNTAPYLLLPSMNARDEAYVLGVMCSIPFDWSARRVVETHVNLHILYSLPLPRPPMEDPLRQRVVEIAAILAAVDDRYTAWAEVIGVPIGGVALNQREPWLAELDAAVSLLYDLDDDDVHVMFETFHKGWDYETRLDAVVEHRERLRQAG
jgi:hypothetical protein